MRAIDATALGLAAIVPVPALATRHVLLVADFVDGVDIVFESDFVSLEPLFDVTAQQRAHVELRAQAAPFVTAQQLQADLILEANRLRKHRVGDKELV